jgi:hypothetical protein
MIAKPPLKKNSERNPTYTVDKNKHNNKGMGNTKFQEKNRQILREWH